MKTLQSGSLLFLFAFISMTSLAQVIPINEPDYNKPKLFQDLPDRLPVEISALDHILNLQIGQDVHFNLINNTLLQGRVVSASVKFSSIQSITVRSTNLASVSFCFSKIKQANGSINYTGRIISRQHADGFVLIQENRQYFLVKKNFYDMINE